MNDEIRTSSVDDILDFKPNLFQKIWWPTRRFIKDIPWKLKQVKFFIQRGKRGWADCDWWEMHYYLTKITLSMLKELKKNSHGFPGHGKASTSEEWDMRLDEMIEAFEAAKRVSEDEYYKEVSGDSLEAVRKATSKEIRECGKLNLADQKLFKKKIKVFVEWFFNLWD